MRTAPGVLTALAALVSGEAVRLHLSGEEPGAGAKTARIHGASLERETGCSVHVPELAIFRENWERMTAENDQDVPEDDDRVRLVVGVFSAAGCQDRPFRDVIRSTWMAQKGVCPLGRGEGPQAGCSLHVTFVVGRGGQGGETEHGEDMTVLPIRENMNCGKSPAWFQHASRKYPWATHIVKMDLDAFPYVPRLVQVIRQHQRGVHCRSHIGGRSVLDNPTVEPNETLRGPPAGSNLLRCSYNRPVGCWSYMQGGLYFLTTELARNASAPGGWWQEESKKCDPEDAIAGKAIFKYGMTKNVCVGALRISNQEFWHPL